jgi:hypothetical protein
VSETTNLPSPEAFSLRNLARRARAERIGSPALILTSLALCVMAAALLVWAGIVTGWVRIILLLLAAAAISLRRLAGRLGAVAGVDGVDEPTPHGPRRRWIELWEVVAVLLAAGFCAYGSGSRLGPAVGALAALLVLAGGWLSRKRPGAVPAARPGPSSTLAVVCLVAAVEPLWGWRGQSLVIGLCLISAILAWRDLRILRMWGVSVP